MLRKRKTEKSYSVDALMLNIAKTLVRDFQDLHGDPGMYHTLQTALRAGNVPGIRQATPVADIHSDNVSKFKTDYQLESLLKRYRFQRDLYTDGELVERAISSFRETQDRLRRIQFDSTPWMVNAVLDLASDYISKVLGVYDANEHQRACGFGSGATVGVPARLACEGQRWAFPMTGSRDEIDWFDADVASCESVQNYWRAQKDMAFVDNKPYPYQLIDRLTLTLVPKSYKSLRSIVPSSTVGSYLSRGLGTMISNRLQRKGYDIRKLQELHKNRAQAASTSLLDVTVDLSSASDSISVALVKRLLPEDWFDKLNRLRVGSLLLPDGTSVEMETFSLMGNGYTFPLQTLIFIALLKAVEGFWFNQLKYPKNYGRITVYGDDMIFHRDMFVYVNKTFSALGFVINEEKSFVDGNFRESCGGDYFRGVDVRPFQPRGGSAFMGKVPYESYLYKMINGLLRRWSEYEVGRTLNYLMSELESVVHKVKIVPGYFSDDSGIRCSSLHSLPAFVGKSKHCAPKHVGHGVFRFVYLRLIPESRKEERHAPYLWCALSTAPRDPDTWVRRDSDRENIQETGLVKSIDESFGICGPSALLEHRVVLHSPLSNTGFVLRLRTGTTSVVISHTGKYQRQFGVTSQWTP